MCERDFSDDYCDFVGLSTLIMAHHFVFVIGVRFERVNVTEEGLEHRKASVLITCTWSWATCLVTCHHYSPQNHKRIYCFEQIL